ncbi:eukaryotic translation initiation factor 3 subunit C, partial [Trifolium medium]|nr:eukaryotic translation initiation factor 3 subunit C [Trifolium medium]
DALNVSSGKGGGRRKRAKSKGGDKWNCFHCKKKGHLKRDCPELNDKDNDDSVHVGEGSSNEGYEKAEALVVSSWESEESMGMDSVDSGDSHDLSSGRGFFLKF